MANKVQYGLKNVHYATVTVGTNSVTYGTPVAWPGAVSLSLSAEGETNVFFADNVAFYTAISNNGYSGDFESALIPDTFKADIMGETVGTGAKSGVYYEDANVQPKAFALLFQFEGDETATKHVLYNCKMTRPDIESSTTEEGIEVQTVTGEITASPRAFDQKVKASCANTAASAYSTWFTTVCD
ncbi:MAG: phage tail protein [Clostridia bacterium]|nr:phage tail protein [Clostridia bacterium]